MKVTIHLNEARGSYFDGFVPSQAELVNAGTYELPATDYVPPTATLSQVISDDVERAVNQELYAIDILRRVYDQLNVGGDVIPAEDYTTQYRARGHRSLSVGDLITIEDDSTVLGYQATFAVERVGFKRVLAANIVIRRGVRRFNIKALEGAYA